MNVNLELPEWIGQRRISIIAGVEEVAHKLSGRPWEVKVQRCNNCGKCCRDCEHLVSYPINKKICGLAAEGKMPYSCLVGDGWPGECNIEWQSTEQD